MDVNTTNTTAKKRVLALALALILLLLALTRVTLSYFTDTKKATNTFTYGKISIQQLESNTKDGNDFTENGLQYDTAFLPVKDSSASSDVIRNDTNYKWKRIKVKNSGTEAAYIRTFIRVPTKLVSSVTPILHLDFSSPGLWKTYSIGEETVYCYTKNDALAGGSTTGHMLKGAYLDSRANIKAMNEAEPERKTLVYETENGRNVYDSGIVIPDDRSSDDAKLLIEVVTQAVQANGFDSAAEALNTAFESSTSRSAIEDPWGNIVPKGAL